MWLPLLILSITGWILTIILRKRSQPSSGWYGGRKREKSPRLETGAIIAGIVSFGLTIVFMWTSRPWWHWMWFGFYRILPFWILTVAIIIVAAVIATLTKKTTVWKVAGISWLVLLAILSLFGRPIVLMDLYAEATESLTIVKTLPITTEVRYLPLEVARYYAETRFPDPEISLGEFEPIMKDGKLVWIASRMPGSFIRSLKYKTDGVAVVYPDGSVRMHHTSRQLGLEEGLEKVPGTFTYGEGMRVVDNIRWKLRESRYWVDYCEIFYLFDGETPVAVAPYIAYRMSFPVMVPYWAGVATVYPDGTIIHYAPEEAQNLDFVQGQRIYPEKLARRYVDSWRYHQGISNAWFTHRGQIDIPKLAYSQNQMPYLLPTIDGAKWTVVAEPWGEAYGIFKIFFIDAITGKIELYEIPPDTNDILIGPNRAWEYVKSAYPLYGWLEISGTTTSGSIKLLEPRPIITEDTIYWMMSVTTKDHAFAPDRPSTMLVDARIGKVYEFSSEEEVRKFLAGEPVMADPEPLPPDVPQLLEEAKELLKQLEQTVKELEELLKP